MAKSATVTVAVPVEVAERVRNAVASINEYRLGVYTKTYGAHDVVEAVRALQVVNSCIVSGKRKAKKIA